MLHGAHQGLRTSSLPSYAGLQLSPYRFITSAAVGRAPPKRQSLLFHRPLPESKHNDIYKRSSKSVPKRPPSASPHSQGSSSARRNRPPLPGICIDPATFTQIGSSYFQVATAGDSRKPSAPSHEWRSPVRDAPPIIPGPVSSQISRAAASVDVQQASSDEANTSSDRGGEAKAIRDPAHLRAPKGSTSKGDTRPPMKLLKPYDLALELQRLCGQGDVDGAVRRLQSTPKDAQNTSVWNTMISLCTHAGRYKRAYEVFTDMKRRGFSPNVATFSTLLKGLSQIDDWSKHSKQLANAHTIYGYYVDHIRSVKYHEPDNTKELSTVPLVFYLSILGEVGDRQKIFDVFFAMDAEGTLRAGQVPVLFHSPSNTAKVGREKRRGFELDSRVIGAAIRALTRGRPNDQVLALDIATKYLGFAMLGERATAPSFQCRNIGFACTSCGRSSKDSTWTNRTSVKSSIGATSINSCARILHLRRRGSPDESLQALEVLEWCLENDVVYQLPKLRPDRQTYHLLFMACWRNGDWIRLTRGFELMTGIRATSFHDLNQEQGPHKLLERPANSNLSPDLETMSFIIRTALATKSLNHYKHAMWLAECVDLDTMLQNPQADAFYRARVAVPLVRIINHLRGEVPTEKHLAWNRLLHIAEKVTSDGERAANRHRRPLGRTSSFEEGNGALSDTRDDDPDTQDTQLL
ncbi:hypothetical protein EDD16DRAFT_1895578 [Pisolithus croceorrhizus]|nr:hypothetical protein EDD16DRAFT_1895578 [Pisolithus croceorrhizus]